MFAKVHNHMTFQNKEDFNTFKNMFVKYRILNLNTIKQLPESIKTFGYKDSFEVNTHVIGIIQYMHAIGIGEYQILKQLIKYIDGAEYRLIFSQYIGGGNINSQEGIQSMALKMYKEAVPKDPDEYDAIFNPNSTAYERWKNARQKSTPMQYKNMVDYNSITKEGWMHTNWGTINNTSRLNIDESTLTLSFETVDEVITPMLGIMHQRSGNIPFRLTAYYAFSQGIPKYNQIYDFDNGTITTIQNPSKENNSKLL